MSTVVYINEELITTHIKIWFEVSQVYFGQVGPVLLQCEDLLQGRSNVSTGLPLNAIMQIKHNILGVREAVAASESALVHFSDMGCSLVEPAPFFAPSFEIAGQVEHRLTEISHALVKAKQNCSMFAEHIDTIKAAFAASRT